MHKPEPLAENSKSVKLSSQNLAKQIFNAELPEQFVRTIPAQSLYMTIKRNGLHSSADLIEIATIEQCRLMLDFDCWSKWDFNEENFWEWLALTDENDSLLLLQKLIKCADLKLIALLIARYVSVETFETPTDSPPGPGYFTPDQGSTWIFINLEDGTRHLLFGRLLALIFETNAGLFYNLLQIPTTTTNSVLEEDSYSDRNKRLASEGIPDFDTAHQINSPIPAGEIESELKKAGSSQAILDIRPIEPLIYDSLNLKPLSFLFDELEIREDLEIELSYILNAAIVYWQADFSDYEKVQHLVAKVKGAANIGLEVIMNSSKLSALQIYQILGLGKIYRFGLSQLFSLRKNAKSASETLQKNNIFDSENSVVLDSASLKFPEIPEFLKEGRSSNDLELKTTGMPLETWSELELIAKYITDLKI